MRISSSATASAASFSRVAASHAESESAATPMSIAAPETGHAPSAPRSLAAISGGAMANPRPQPRQPIGLAERAQNESPGGLSGEAEVRIEKVGEGLVDDEQPAAPVKAQRERAQAVRRDDPPIGIVRIDDDGDILVFEFAHVVDDGHRRAARRPAPRVLEIGKAEHADPLRRKEMRQPVDDRLRSRRRDDARLRANRDRRRRRRASSAASAAASGRRVQLSGGGARNG